MFSGTVSSTAGVDSSSAGVASSSSEVLAGSSLGVVSVCGIAGVVFLLANGITGAPTTQTLFLVFGTSSFESFSGSSS